MMAGWGRALQITFGAFGILGVLADGAATAAQIINPNPQTQAALDILVLRYDEVLAIRLRGGGILPESAPYQNLAGALDQYLASIQAPALVRTQIHYQLLDWLAD